MATEQKLTAQQRAALFSASTRQHFQMIGKQEVTGGAQTITFRVPKARILQGVRVRAEYTMKLTHATATSLALGKLDPYKLFRRCTIDLNNGFQPVTVSGYEMALINTLYPNANMVEASADGHTLCKAPASLTASAAGTDNAINFMLDIPLTLNYRDCSGLVLAQNQETTIEVSFDIGNAADIIGKAAGFTAELGSVKVECMASSFSVPARSEWFPDLSILKVLSSRSESFTEGPAYVKLQTGFIYRKMILIFTNEDGTPMSADDITSNIEIVLNTADTPYSISPKMLRDLNKMQNGIEMPEGIYFWSFDWQGLIGMGGSRDYIDAERVSELSVRFNAAKNGKLTVVSEKISRLIANP